MYKMTCDSKINLLIINQEEFEDTKVLIRIRISKKNRQHNGQKKKYKNVYICGIKWYHGRYG
jgi:hypothetical protein